MPNENGGKPVSPKKVDEARYRSFKIALVYLILGLLWIVFSDSFVSKIFVNAEYVMFFSIVKGIFYVFVTAALIFALIYAEMKKVFASKVILEEKNAELTKSNELQQSLHKEMAKDKILLRSLIDSIPDLVFFKDINGVYLGCNLASEKHVGVSRKDIVGKTDFDIFPKERAELYREGDNEAIKTKLPVRIEETISDDGMESIIYEKLKTPLYDPDNNIIGTIGVARDITERRKIEEEIFYQ